MKTPNRQLLPQPINLKFEDLVTFKQLYKPKQLVTIECSSCGRLETKRLDGVKTRYCRQCNLKKTCLEKYGYSNVFKSPIIKERIKQTNLEKYGVVNSSQSSMVKEKKTETTFKHFGVKHPIQSSEVKEKIKQTNLERYGCEYPTQNKDVREKVIKTNLERYGVESISQSPHMKDLLSRKAKEYWNNLPLETKKSFRITHGAHKYEYKNQIFDSSWELQYFIYLEDHNIEFEYQPDPIPYQFGGTTHWYHPDFKIGDQLIEIKGPQFLDENGNLTNPYLKTKTIRDEAKTNHMKSHKVRIVLEKEMKPIQLYIRDEYGKNYIQQLEVNLYETIQN